MIRIEVVGYRGLPPSEPLSAEFGESGGTIGRADGSTLVLSDPARTISRTHAAIAWRGGCHVIRNFGTATPVFLNDRSLANGEEEKLSIGDEIRIGDYLMRVAAGVDAAAPVREARGAGLASMIPKDDPLDLFDRRPGADLFGDLPAPDPMRRDPSSQKPSRENDGWSGHTAASDPAAISSFSSGPPHIIPPDFDPFAPGPSPPPATSFIPRPDDVSGGLDAVLPEMSIDDLFPELDRETAFDPLASDAPLAPPADLPDGVSSDPLVAMGAMPRKPVPGKVQRDDASELVSPFRPPAARPAPPGGSEPTLSWTDEERSGAARGLISVIVPSPTHGGRRGEASRDEPAPLPRSHLETTATPSRNEQEPAPVAGARDGAATGHDELLRAFLAGAGVPDLTIPAGLTPQFMDTLGQLLRVSTQGTLDLLMARSFAKREVRADLTMISARENNPLKFSPGVEAALSHLLAPQGHGFMAPLQAMKDAHDDLRSHQFGFMAGMRAALASVLERFDPAELERRLTQKTVIDSLIPSHRKAKLWDMFADRYGEISREAEEDFHALFGKEFLRAYEAQLARLERDDNERQKDR